MRKLVSVVMCVAMVATMAACGGKEAPESNTPSTSVSVSVSTSSEDTKASVTTEEEVKTDTSVEDVVTPVPETEVVPETEIESEVMKIASEVKEAVKDNFKATRELTREEVIYRYNVDGAAFSDFWACVAENEDYIEEIVVLHTDDVSYVRFNVGVYLDMLYDNEYYMNFESKVDNFIFNDDHGWVYAIILGGDLKDAEAIIAVNESAEAAIKSIIGAE